MSEPPGHVCRLSIVDGPQVQLLAGEAYDLHCHSTLFAETDLLVAASTCPGGDLSVPLWGPGSDAEPSCHPIGVEVLRAPRAAA